nr:hypothetical protein [Tanacetum cinerariifolium]
MLMKRIGKLEHIMVNLIQENKHLEERLDCNEAHLYTLENLDIPHQVSKAIDEIVTDVVDWAIQAPLRNHFRDLPEADMKEILHQKIWETNSCKTHKDHKMMYEALEKSMNHDHSKELVHQELQDLQEFLDPHKCRHYLLHLLHQPRRNAHIPKVNLRQDWWKPLKEERPATPEPAWSILSSDVSYQMEECHKLLTDSVDDSILRHNVSKPFPLGGPPGQVIIQSDFFYNKDLEFLRYGSKGSRPALSISKMKAAYYPDVGLEQMVTDQMWIDEERKYDIVVMYEDFQLRIESYQTQLTLTKPRWNAMGFEYKHDYMVIDSLRSITFWDRYEVQMIMRFNEIHKFSDGTLHQIDEALDYRFKKFTVYRMNPGLNTRFWTRKDVDKSKEFMLAIQKRLKTRRIFCNLESFVGGRVKDKDYRLLKPWIHPIDLELLDPVIQCLINLLQRAITELVDLIEVHNHLNPISIPKRDEPWRIDDCVVVLVFEARGIPSRFGEVQLSL